MPRARGRPALPGALGRPTGTPACSSRPGTRGRRPRRPRARLTGRTHGEGHRDGAGPAAGRAGAQRRPRRPRRVGQDHPGRGPARGHRRAAAGRAGRGRHDLPGHRGRRGPPAALGLPRASPPSSTPGTGSPCSTPPARPTSWVSCGPGCGPPTPPCSSSRRSTGSTRPPSQLWEECAAVGMPRAVVITQLDRARADVDDAVRLCQRMLGEGVYPMHLLDRGADGAVRGLVSLLEPRRRRRRRPTGSAAELIEGIIGESEDEALMERYLAGDELVRRRPGRRPGDRRRPRRTSTRSLCVAPLSRGRASPQLLDLLVAGFPCPARARLPGGHPPRRLAGAGAELRPGRPAGRRGREDDDRPLPGPGLPGPRLLRHPAPRHPRSTSPGTAWPTAATPTTTSTSGSARSPRRSGATLRPVAACPAGDICAVARLASAETGDTLSSPGGPAARAAVGPAHPAAAGRGRGGLPHATRTGWPARWPGWSPRTRPCGWSAGPTPASCCSGAWATRTPRCCSSGCAPGTASR